MTAFDTTNARITFTAPANGIVLVKVRVAGKGANVTPQTLLGAIESSPSAGTLRGRQVPYVSRANVTPFLHSFEAVYPVTGLTPSTSYTWDAAYGVETFVASTQFGWGGPNNTTASDAYGALSFEIWETTGILGAKHYDPTGAAMVSKDTGTAALALTALDTTNLRLAFTTPASGAGSSRVFVRLRGAVHGATGKPQIHLGVLEGSTVKLRMAAADVWPTSTTAATDMVMEEVSAVVGVSASTSYTWDAAYAVETVLAATGLKYGGPDNTTANDAAGGFTFEVWPA
jgi:hypothetical protein